MAAHHRKMRSQGGKDLIHNLLALHHACHNLATGAVHLDIKTSYKYGWIVPSYSDPVDVPVLLHKKRAVQLTENGSYQRVNYCFDCASHVCEKGETHE